MATPTAAGDVIEQKMYAFSEDQLGINIRHWIVVGADPGANLEDLAADIWATVAANYVACLSSKAELVTISLRILRPSATAEVFTTIAALPGTNTGDIMARVVSGIITYRSGLPGRANRGRMYVPFPSEADNDADGHPTSSYITRLATLAGFFANPQILGTPGTNEVQLSPVINHRGTSTTTGINAFLARSQWASQHRRGDYGKLNRRPA